MHIFRLFKSMRVHVSEMYGLLEWNMRSEFRVDFCNGVCLKYFIANDVHGHIAHE